MIIDRKRWARVMRDGSTPNGDSSLLNKQDNMCCLGFDCANNGEHKERLRGQSFPYYMNSGINFLKSSLTKEQCDTAVQVNDRHGEYINISDAKQEAAIAAIFLQAGIAVTFIN